MRKDISAIVITKTKGTGFGLAIGKQFIKVQCGTIVFEKNRAGGDHIPYYPSLHPSVKSASSDPFILRLIESELPDPAFPVMKVTQAGKRS